MQRNLKQAMVDVSAAGDDAAYRSASPPRWR
jgi:hypothetical protein